MSKRPPEFQLTKDNYNDVDENDSNDQTDLSINDKAPADVLKGRVFLKAKRRNLDHVDSETPSKSVFSGFKGFTSIGSNSTNAFQGFNFDSATSNSNNNSPFNAPMFKFGSNNSTSNSNVNDKKETENDNNSLNDKSDNSKVTTSITSVSEPLKTSSDESKTKDDQSKDNQLDSDGKSSNATFHANLSKLNKSFAEHIQRYTTKSESIYDLTLVCEEYISKCCKLRQMSNDEKQSIEKSAEDKNSKTNQSELFSFGSTSAAQNTKPLGDAPKTTTNSTTATTSEFKFSTSNSLFPFAMPKLGTGFANPFPIPQFGVKKPNTDDGGDESSAAADAEDTDQPPKVTSVEHNEEDSVYSKKCKLYYKKEDSFVEKGVGFLYIKVKDETSKPQLLIRADTNTGNILLNIALIESLPIIKAENNKGVLITCVPNPPIEIKKKKDDADEKKTVTFLIRVKATDCDELHQNLMKHKK